MSDDDYARVTIAQTFAVSPHWDPTGSSWLPFPFLATGGVMMLLGRSLVIAQAFAIACAAGSGALLVVTGRVFGLSPGRALIATMIPLSIPLHGALCAATVPELPVAVAVTYAIAASAKPSRWWWTAPLALIAACLSRYEAWPIAAFLALVACRYLGRLDLVSSRRAVFAAALGLCGPLLWILWNFHAYGDPLAFARRVAAYHATFQGLDTSAFQRLKGYPWSILREGPGLCVLALYFTWRRGISFFRKWRRPLLAAVILVVGLVAAEARGGAPTHHPERAVVVVWLLLSFMLVAAWEPANENVSHKFLAQRWAVALVLLVSMVGTFNQWRFSLGFDRRSAVALGLALREQFHPGQRVLWVPSSYEFFATAAALGRPEDLYKVVPRSVDPRSTEPDPFQSHQQLQALLCAVRPTVLILDPDQVPMALTLGFQPEQIVNKFLIRSPQPTAKHREENKSNPLGCR